MRNWIATLAFACCCTGGLAFEPPRVIFSQEVSAFDAMGNPYPAQSIDPSQIPGMRRLVFPLSSDQSLAVETNLEDPVGRGVATVAERVARCLAYVETQTGRHLSGDILLYIIELDHIPLAYRFRAAYESEVAWLEVRLALIEAGQPLHGPEIAPALSHLLFATLPHELGHDVFRDLPGLLIDTDGAPSHHTRWFTEGVCEVLAKGFTATEAPHLLPDMWARRHGGSIIWEPGIERALFEWEQENENSLQLESDLYGASLLVTLAALERIQLGDLVALVSAREELDGPALLALLKQATGLDTSALLARGRQLAQAFEAWGIPIPQPARVRAAK